MHMKLIVEKWSLLLVGCFLLSYADCWAAARGRQVPAPAPIVRRRPAHTPAAAARPRPVAPQAAKSGHVLQPQGPANIEEMLGLQERLTRERAELDIKIKANEERLSELLGAGTNQRQILELTTSNEGLVAKRAGIIEQLDRISGQVEQAFMTAEGAEAAPVVGDIDRIVAEHSRPVEWDGKLFVRGLAADKQRERITYKNVGGAPKSFEQGLIQVTQLGALGQRRSPGDHNNYCGYYAVYNVLCLSLGVDRGMQDQLLNRKAFAELFARMLQQVKSERHKEPYDNLAEDEIEQLLHSVGISADQYVCVQLRMLGEDIAECGFTDLAIGLEQSGDWPVAYDTIENFKARRTDNLNILFNVGAHWVAIKAQRTDRGIHFFIVDSLNEVDWTSEDIVQHRLVPLYRFITN